MGGGRKRRLRLADVNAAAWSEGSKARAVDIVEAAPRKANTEGRQGVGRKGCSWRKEEVGKTRAVRWRGVGAARRWLLGTLGRHLEEASVAKAAKGDGM